MLRLSSCLCMLFTSTLAMRAAEIPPNIVLMMADDMGIGDTSAFQDVTGNADDDQVHTPHMERLARMGSRFIDAHTPSSRCSPTRYALLTGRYPWRNRLKHWVLYGAQGDPMIEADRPTIASMLKSSGYRTGIVGKWHVGLRYRRSDGAPAAGWHDADLTQPLHTTPLDHGFDFVRITSRSHGTSGPDASRTKRNGAQQTVGPGHIHDRTAVGASGNGKELVRTGVNAYKLTKLGSRHSNHAMQFLRQHVTSGSHRQRPFFLYYPANSNHGPYTPDKQIGGVPVREAARTKSGNRMDARHDFIHENDVALGRLLDWLADTDDPRVPHQKLIHNTLVIFTSDNGAEKNSRIATGPYRSNKGSVYEGGHRVPFLVAWAAGNIGDGNPNTPGVTNNSPIALQDLYATFAEIVGASLPDLTAGNKGAEDSFSVLPAFRGETLDRRPPLFFNDHKEAKDHAASALRMDNLVVGDQYFRGQWKLFFDARLLRNGQAVPYELYNLAADPTEANNLIADSKWQPLVAAMKQTALLHRTAGGHRLANEISDHRILLDFRNGAQANPLAEKLRRSVGLTADLQPAGSDLHITLRGVSSNKPIPQGAFDLNETGLGIVGRGTPQVDSAEAVLLEFSTDVVVESVALMAGPGACGGFYQIGESAPLALYCLDADIDALDQSGIVSDIGFVRAGVPLRLDSSPHFGTEEAGAWRLQAVVLRTLKSHQ